MLKVLIADDEKKICRLIEMLCDWSKLDMEVVGNARNGIEAIEKLESLKPDILILDIKMPGCDGIEVARRAAEANIPVQIMIVSGHADFEYAHAAIRYGVKSYLLKPIKKPELEEELLKLSQSYHREKERKVVSDKLQQYMEDESRRKRQQFFEEFLLSERKRDFPSIDEVDQMYQYKFFPGKFRVLVLQMHYDPQRHDRLILEKTINTYSKEIETSFSKLCVEMERYLSGNKCYILCNYQEDRRKEVEEGAYALVRRLSAQRFLLWEIEFSAGLGKEADTLDGLWDSARDALLAVKEVLKYGRGKLLEAPSSKSASDYAELLRTFKQRYESAAGLQDAEAALKAAEELQRSVESDQRLSGKDIFDIVCAAGRYMHLAAEGGQNTAEARRFCAECELYSSEKELFDRLKEEIGHIISEARGKNPGGRRSIQAAAQYMQAHYMNPLTLESVAEVAGFSGGYFGSLFKKEMGEGFNEYLVKIRMDEAKKLLKDTEINIKDICERVGYQDTKYFTGLFRKHTGLKPREYRKLYS